LPTFFAAAKKVGAAPHRGRANKPIAIQEKAKEPEQQQKTKAPQAKSFAEKNHFNWSPTS
jgi:hypothetical protein